MRWWEWDPLRKVHRCSRCLRWTRGGGRRAKSSRCRPLQESEKGNLVRFGEQGHKLWQIAGVRGNRAVVFCASCGCYVMSGRGVGLNQLCKGGCSGQKARLKKLSRGLHPVTGQLLGEATRLKVTDRREEELMAEGLRGWEAEQKEQNQFPVKEGGTKSGLRGKQLAGCRQRPRPNPHAGPLRCGPAREAQPRPRVWR